MGSHNHHDIHVNSQESWEQVRKRLPTRGQIIADNLRSSGDATDRQIMERLGYIDMNQVRPTITRLLKRGILLEVGSAKCAKTGRRVRRVGVPTYLGQQQSFGFAWRGCRNCGSREREALADSDFCCPGCEHSWKVACSP